MGQRIQYKCDQCNKVEYDKPDNWIHFEGVMSIESNLNKSGLRLNNWSHVDLCTKECFEKFFRLATPELLNTNK